MTFLSPKVIQKVACSPHSRTKLSRNEAKAYLEMNDWEIDQAIANAVEDLEFEAGQRN